MLKESRETEEEDVSGDVDLLGEWRASHQRQMRGLQE